MFFVSLNTSKYMTTSVWDQPVGIYYGRHADLMINVLDSGLKGVGLSSCRGHAGGGEGWWGVVVTLY